MRTSINTWVAKYRRSDKFAGRPSFSNTYAVCNTLAGHYNSFGVKAPLPKKRLERLTRVRGGRGHMGRHAHTYKQLAEGA